MNTETLIQIMKTRIAAEKGNHTGQSFLYEVVKALERLEQYEKDEEKQQ